MFDEINREGESQRLQEHRWSDSAQHIGYLGL